MFKKVGENETEVSVWIINIIPVFILFLCTIGIIICILKIKQIF